MQLLPLVSVIIPAFNADRFITRTLESVLSQSYSKIEVIVVDDGSTDETAEIVRSFAQDDSRVRLLQQCRLGVAKARNLAIKVSRGSFIAPIDADDFWHHDKLKEQVECMLHGGPGVGLVYSWSVMTDENEIPILGITADWMGDVLVELIYSNFIGNGSAALFRRSLFEHVGGFDSEVTPCEDWDLYIKIAELSEVRVVPEYRVAYRRVLSGGSADYERMEQSFELMMSKTQKRRPDLPASVYRLSRSAFFLYLTGKSSEKTDYGRTFSYLFRSLQLDKTLLLSSRFFKILLKTVIKVASAPVTSLIWNNADGWGNFRRRMRRILGTTSHPGSQTGLWSFSQERKIRLYDLIKNGRIARLTEQVRAKNEHAGTNPIPSSAVQRKAAALKGDYS